MIETFFIIFLLFFIIIFKYLYYTEVSYVETFDSNKYLVRNLPDKNEAAELLAKIRQDLLIFINSILKDIKHNKYDEDRNNKLNTNYKYIKRIAKKLPNSIISESSGKSQYTSYSINKGEELVFCLRSKDTNKLHDINNIMYVAIHEISHIGCPEIGHTDLFQEINKFLLEEAIHRKIYKYFDYANDNQEYCGILLTSNILD